MANKEAKRVITRGNRYVNKETKETVVVFYIDHIGSSVRFSPEGPGSGREYTMDIDNFLRTHDDAPAAGDAA